MFDSFHVVAQARALANAFPERAKGIAANPREDLAVELFGRVTDAENFSAVLATLNADAQLSAGRRLGWLNILNPHQIDRCGGRGLFNFIVCFR